ncbi:amidinotransferase [Elizabethkingia miricola]|uniref:Amidinotransferase n=1 Tax=Elizabethkingia miricola TaxID=172045 RepID=A0AAQ1SYI0_ELIMR|nr:MULTISPECIES: arginine deiminase-related protein [Elizabethkingia]KUY13887.1 amidinotransferase [Elizabethkingia miricola]MCL1651847.1 arginine deiminase-related protein [Elizabethkingia miricola]MCL1679373.1 arginine deiminase-related protein [Elizabethkingia miricola]OPC40761.1 amidinotransferase [Elizabethkingia miricola]OPC67714.1 amidinotransferase [Elizabethkingia miricola]
MQSTDTILMIEPVAFGFNAQTAVNNYFQVNDESKETQSEALREFNAFVDKLRSKGVNVITVKDTLDPHTPDSIFPNNWVSFHQDGTVILYPMFAENRRLERRNDILDELSGKGLSIAAVKDYSVFEAENKFLEGTGSMILDRENKIAYGAVSLRLDEEVFKKWCAELGYKPVVFHSFQSVNGERLPIYHTNVMMCVGSDYAVICLDTIDDATEREQVEKALTESHKEVIEITEEQMQNFAGNMLEVRNNEGHKFLVMSECAYKSLTSIQIQTIEAHAEILYSDLHTIEKNGGGSARCMMAEVFLPKK